MVISRISKTVSLGSGFKYTNERSPVHKTAEDGIVSTSFVFEATPFILPETNMPGLNKLSLLLNTTLKVTVRVFVFKVGSIKSTFPVNSLFGYAFVVLKPLALSLVIQFDFHKHQNSPKP